VPQLVIGALPLPTAVAKRLQGDIQADLVPILEAVCHGLRGTVDLDRDPFDFVPLNALSQGLP
jgi:hypothetical protein